LHYLLVISKLSMLLCSMVYRQEWAKTVKRVKAEDEKFVLHILYLAYQFCLHVFVALGFKKDGFLCILNRWIVHIKVMIMNHSMYHITISFSVL